MKPVPVLPRPPSPRLPKSPSDEPPAALADWINWTSFVVVAEGERVREVDRRRPSAGPARCRGYWCPPARRQLEVRLLAADDRRAVRAVRALERHAGDVDRLRLDVEVDDEVFGPLVRQRWCRRAGCRRRRSGPGIAARWCGPRTRSCPAGKPGRKVRLTWPVYSRT